VSKNLLPQGNLSWKEDEMDALTSLIAAILTSLFVSSVVLLVILKPLGRVISMFCREAEATPFWTSFTAVMLYAVPLLFALWWTPVYPDGVSVVRGALAATLLGLIGGLGIIGFKVSRAKMA
jgi:hypothetical protein